MNVVDLVALWQLFRAAAMPERLNPGARMQADLHRGCAASYHRHMTETTTDTQERPFIDRVRLGMVLLPIMGVRVTVGDMVALTVGLDDA